MHNEGTPWVSSKIPSSSNMNHGPLLFLAILYHIYPLSPISVVVERESIFVTLFFYHIFRKVRFFFQFSRKNKQNLGF